MKLWRIVRIATTIFYSIACALFILAGSYRDYEWMAGEVLDGEKITLCNLPTPSDDSHDLLAVMTFLPMLLLYLIGVINSLRLRRITLSLVLSLGLFLYWVYEFFLRTLNC